ncbi:hypothetical protein HUE56_14920 [Azospirillum oryzae]|uniref:Uncharacterized protein n=1 Tax=Azospirillum oryzae TaxID=286727 RepID=A0A6N1ARG6_9PROT|nr:hypothetical protein [Azospirillum oryzae]QKS51744.1 hypothetical protein HUE56_14920 [Azospirillum oryzae]
MEMLSNGCDFQENYRHIARSPAINIAKIAQFSAITQPLARPLGGGQRAC